MDGQRPGIQLGGVSLHSCKEAALPEDYRAILVLDPRIQTSAWGTKTWSCDFLGYAMRREPYRRRLHNRQGHLQPRNHLVLYRING
jgi:hypothetical protein